jgi:site-specific DNA-cytosine methylase
MRIYSQEGKSVTQSAGGGGLGGKTGLYAIKVDEPMRVKEATKQGYVDINVGDCVDLTQPNSKTRRGRSLTNKSNCITTTTSQYEYCGVLGYATPVEWDEKGCPIKAVSCADGKTYTVYEVKNGLITIKGKEYPIKLIDGYYIIRKLTVRECARLQTMPDNYCKAVSDSQAYKALGNGWTAEVIIHLLNHALKDVPRDEEIVVLSMYDGIATGRYCLDKMGFTNVTYHAYEIDKYPIMVAMDNYPDIIQHGDAFAVREDDWQPPQTRSEWLDELLGDSL